MVAFIFYQCDKWLQIWMKFQNLELSMAFKKYKWGLWKILSTINHAHKQCLYTSFFGSSSIERSGFELLWFQIWRWARKNSKFNVLPTSQPHVLSFAIWYCDLYNVFNYHDYLCILSILTMMGNFKCFKVP